MPTAPSEPTNDSEPTAPSKLPAPSEPAPAEPAPANTAKRRRRWRMSVVALIVVLGLAGTAMLGYALTHQQDAPSAQAGNVAPSQTGQPPAPPASAPSAGQDAASPTSIRIPTINVSSPINQVGLNPDRTMEVPQPGPRYDQAAWYRYSPKPGEVGPAVIIGHIDSAANGPSVFFKLGQLRPGQRIDVSRADNTTATFEVDSVASYPKESFPIKTVYGDTVRPELRLITCGGAFDDTNREYLDNTVVFAHLAATTP